MPHARRQEEQQVRRREEGLAQDPQVVHEPPPLGLGLRLLGLLLRVLASWLAPPWVGEGEGEQGGHDDAGDGGEDVGGPPGVSEEVGLGQVDADDEGEAVAVVDAPGEDAVGEAARGGGEEVGDDAAGRRTAYRNAWKRIEEGM